MIPKMDSKTLNETLEGALSAIQDIKKETTEIAQDVAARKRLMEVLASYNAATLAELESNGHKYSLNKKFFYLDEPEGGIYSRYGVMIGAPSLRSIDLFNVKALVEESGESVEKTFFRDIATARIKDTEAVGDSALHALMDYKIPEKGAYVKESFDGSVALTIQALGDQCFSHEDFNVIEIDPYLPCSFTLDHITIYEHSQDEEGKEIALETVKLPKCKLALDRDYRLYRVDLFFTVDTKSAVDSKAHGFAEDAHIFGLKKLGFLKEDLQDGYTVVRFETPNFIRDIKENIVLYGPYGYKESTMYAEGIELFLNYQDGYLHHSLQPSQEGETRVLPINTKSFYARVPVSKQSGLFGMEIKNIYTR